MIMYTKKSFTLIEILIVIGIIVILAGISVPIFKNYQPTLQLNGAVRNLISDLRYAQQLALTEQIEYCLQFPTNFPTDRKYKIIQCSGGQPLKEVSLPDKITNLSFTDFLDNQVEFNPYGAVKKSGTITLKNTKGDEKIIDVKPSGFVKIK